MNIGAVAEKAGVPPRTIRYYENIGLIRKAERLPNGYRAYSATDMRELNFIKRARELGFSVGDVRDLLDLWRNRWRTSAAVKALVTRHLEVLAHKIAELESMRRSLVGLVQLCRGDERPGCPILDDLGRALPRSRK